MSKKKDYREDTKLMHLGRAPEEYFGLVNPPIGRASTILYPSLDAYEDPAHKYRYARLGTPISDKFEQAMSEIEGGFAAISGPSGMAVISTALLGFLKAGDHLLVSDAIYPPTRTFCNSVLQRFGIEVEYYDPQIGSGIGGLIKDNTAVIYMESPGSATFDIIDVPAIVEEAKKKGVVTMLDNSWSGGILFKPLSHGVNIALQSITKYIGGHSDVNLGVAVADTEEHYKTLKKAMWDLGVMAAAEDYSLALRGLRTVKLRLKQNAENAMKVAQFLQGRDEVKRVYYPALESHANHDLWKRDFSGANGVLGVLLKDAPKAAVKAFVESLELFPIGSSWGGYESLLQPQYMKQYRSAAPWEENGFFLRLQIGLEDPEDLIADLEQGFERLRAAV